MDNSIYYLPQASVTLAKSILESQNVKRTTLPTDFNYDPDNILQLFLKPAVKVRVFTESLLAIIACTKQLFTKGLKCSGGWRRASSVPVTELTRWWTPKRLCLAVVLHKGLARELICEEEEEEEEPAGWEEGR